MLGVPGALDSRASQWWPARNVKSTRGLAHQLCSRLSVAEDLGFGAREAASVAAAAGALSVRVRQVRRLSMQRGKEERIPDLKVQLPYDLSEEELLRYELADEDFSLCEEEEEEWRQYDEEVSQFKKLVLECGSDKSSSSSRSSLHKLSPAGIATDADALADAGLLGDLCSEAIVRNEPREALGQIKPSSSSSSVPFQVPGSLINGQFELPREYRQRLENSDGAGVVVTTKSGPNALVLLSHVPDQPQLLPVVSDTFRTQGVKLVRGWMETMDDGVVVGAFEVSDLNGQPLSPERTAQLERALMQAGKEHMSSNASKFSAS